MNWINKKIRNIIKDWIDKNINLTIDVVNSYNDNDSAIEVSLWILDKENNRYEKILNDTVKVKVKL